MDKKVFRDDDVNLILNLICLIFSK